MNNRVLGASYELGIELKEAGCPIDYLNALPRMSFRAEQLPGYVVSRVFVCVRRDPVYVIAFRLATNCPSGTIISGWDFELPWGKPSIDWDYDREDIIPEAYRGEYKGLFNSRLMGALNGDRKIRIGSPVDGVLGGFSIQPIVESSRGVIPGKLSFTDNRGYTARLCIDLNIDTHSYSSASRLLSGEAGQRVSRLHDELIQLAATSDSERESGSPPGFAGVSRDRTQIARSVECA